jgi:hypothetical protein
VTFTYCRPEAQSSEGSLSAAELEQLEALVSQDLKALLQDDPQTDEINYAQILQRLNSTDAMAKGVESKLDNILGNLDALLESLGSAEEGGSGATSVAPTRDGLGESNK